MTAEVWIRGLALACMLHLAAGIPVQPDFDYQRVPGVWHRIAMVASGADPQVIGADIKISALPKGKLVIQRSTVVRDTCRLVEFRYKPSDIPGKFIIYYATGGPSTAHFVDTDYTVYLILHVATASDTGLYLYARTFDVPDAVKEKYRSHVRSLGFSESHIAYPGRDERCPI